MKKTTCFSTFWRSMLTKIFIFLISTITTLSHAAPIPPPNPNSINAVRAFVGDPLLGLKIGDAGVIYTKNPDSPAGEASSTKSWAIHLGTKAVNDGLVDYDDTVIMSSNALIPRAHNHSNMGGTVPSPGDQFIYSDMLHASMIPSSSEATLAFGEYVAQKDNPAHTSGAAREQHFVNMMNNHAISIGLVNTVFFNPYGGDHLHNSNGGTGASVNHVTTAREMSMWFAHAMEDDLFREVFGFRGIYTLNNIANTNTYTFNNWNPGYPGMLGQKGGGNASCNTCFVGQASRIGREMVVSYLTANANGDGTTLLDYAYQKTFNPDFLAASNNWKSVKQQSLTPVGSKRAVSAAISPGNKVKLVTWKLGLDKGKIEPINNSFLPPCGIDDINIRNPGPTVTEPGNFIATSILSSNNPLTLGSVYVKNTGIDRNSSREERRKAQRERVIQRFVNRLWRKVLVNLGIAPDEVPPAPPVGGQVANSIAISTDVIHAGDGYLVLATETTKGITLTSWGMPQCGPVFFRDSVTIGNGSSVKLAVLNPGLIGVVMINNNDDIEVQTWQLDLSNGQFGDDPLDTALYQGNFVSLDLASREQVILTSNLVAAARMNSGVLRMIAWPVNSNNGDILPHSNSLVEKATAYSLTQVDGFEYNRDVYAVAFRRANGNLRIRLYAVALDGTITNAGNIDNTVYTISEDGATAIESYDKRGVMVMVSEDINSLSSNMTIWSLDDDVLNNTIDVNFVVDGITQPALGAPVIARLPDNKAEGDFLIGQQDFFSDSKQLKLQAWRSGSRN